MSRVDVLLFELKRGWVTYVAMACMLAAIVSMALLQLWKITAHGPKEKAWIVWIGPAEGNSYGPEIDMLVVAKSGDGLIGQASFLPPPDIRGCKVGDEIEAERIGTHLKLNPKPCS
jgi:hypothetical protein